MDRILSLLESNPAYRPRAQCIRETRIPIAIERLGAIRTFYADILGFPLWKDDLPPGGWGVGEARARVFFAFRHDPIVDPMRRRFTIGVQSLEIVAERLAKAQWRFEEYRGWGVTDRAILFFDPQGHRVEVRQFRPI